MTSEHRSNAGAIGSETRREIGRLKIAVVFLTLAWVGTVAWTVLGTSGSPDVLAVERLDIVEPDGELAFVLANSKRGVPATVDGQVILEGQEEERDMPSFVFFDGQGDEVGGMLFLNREMEDGFAAVRHLSLDAYKQDQTVVLTHSQDPDGATSGLMVSDRPERSILDVKAELGLEPGPTREELTEAIEALVEEEGEERRRELFGVHRLFVGSDRANQASLVLRDGQGRARIVAGVPEEGDPFIRILDEAGDPVIELPE